jgi:hypothetical protein
MMIKLLQINIPRLILIFWLSCSWNGFGQDLEAEAKKIKDQMKALKDAPKKMLEAGVSVNGSISNNTTFYQTNSLADGRLPFESILSANLNFDILGKIKMPVTFSFNSQNINFTNPFNNQFRFQQPFNRYQFKPTYKGLTLILGVGSMTFSPFTLNGHRFEGTGVQFKPQKLPFYVNFMLGNLKKSVRIDTSLKTGNNQPAYSRDGLGIQLGYKKKSSGLEFSFFKAQDDPISLPYKIDEFQTPQGNVVMSFKGNTMIKNKLSLMAEIAYSGITQDIRDAAEEPVSNQFSYFNLLHTNRSTTFKTSLKTAIAYKTKQMNLGFDYSRIDPNYRTLGSYYFLNDLEIFNTNVSTQLMQGKLMLMASVGRQRDNLEKTKTQSLSQWIGSSTINYAPTQDFLLNMAYSNSSSFTNLRTDLEYLTTVPSYAGLDTLGYRQINQNLMVNMMRNLKMRPDSLKRTLMVNALFQNSLNAQGGLVQNATIVSTNTQYTVVNAPKNLTYSLGFSLNRNDILLNQEWLLGPSATASRSFFNKKLKTNVGLTFLKTFKSNNANSGIFNARFSTAYSMGKHTLNSQVMYMYQNITPIRKSDKDLWNMTATLSYQYAISYKKSFLKK